MDGMAFVTTAFSLAELVEDVPAELRLALGDVPDLPSVGLVGPWDTRGPTPVRRPVPEPATLLGPGQPRQFVILSLDGRDETDVVVENFFSGVGNGWVVSVEGQSGAVSVVLVLAVLAAVARLGDGRIFYVNSHGFGDPDMERRPDDLVAALSNGRRESSFAAACAAALEPHQPL
jgi:hypothetical protein